MYLWKMKFGIFDQPEMKYVQANTYLAIKLRYRRDIDHLSDSYQIFILDSSRF